jgi:Pilus formation protein N terminal region
MSGLFPRWRGFPGLLACTLCAAAATAANAASETFDVQVDQARIMALPEKVATIVIGNPLIADAALQAGGILVITGKGYGATNMLALDRSGRVIMDKTVQVMSPTGADLVTVYKGVERESYSCSPVCAARITLGDSSSYFTNAMTQDSSRTGGAAGGGGGSAQQAPH